MQRDPIYAPHTYRALKLASPDGAIANLDGNAHTPVAIHRRDLLVPLAERRARGHFVARRGLRTFPQRSRRALEGLIFGS